LGALNAVNLAGGPSDDIAHALQTLLGIAGVSEARGESARKIPLKAAKAGAIIRTVSRIIKSVPPPGRAVAVVT